MKRALLSFFLLKVLTVKYESVCHYLRHFTVEQYNFISAEGVSGKW